MSVCTIGIIGAGVAGSGIAQLSVTAGFDVILVDISDDAVTKSIATIAGNLARLVAKSGSPRRRGTPLSPALRGRWPLRRLDQPTS